MNKKSAVLGRGLFFIQAGNDNPAAEALEATGNLPP